MVRDRGRHRRDSWNARKHPIQRWRRDLVSWYLVDSVNEWKVSEAAMGNLDSLVRLRKMFDTEPSLPIERAAEVLQMSVRNLYRRRSEFEYLRRNGHLHFTIRSIRQHIEFEQYNPTAFHDLTKDEHSPADHQPMRMLRPAREESD